MCSLGDIISGTATERQMNSTEAEAGVMASWKKPNKKMHLRSPRRTGWKQFMGLSLQRVLPRFLAHGVSYANWEQLLSLLLTV